MHSLTTLLDHYGYVVLFIGLMLELIAFPLPGEVLMTYCGVLINQGKLSWALSVLFASIGAILGITFSYYIGRLLGKRFFERHGHYVHLDKDRLDKISLWFNRYGNKLLILAYFIPGVRHITGYFSGITRVSYKEFAINAYSGAFIWTATFISLGKILGPSWEKYHNIIKNYLILGSIILGLILFIIYLYKKYKVQIFEFVIQTLKNGVKTFNSFGTIKIAMLGTTAIFLLFLTLLIGLIQDYLSKEFVLFDNVTKFLVSQIFNENYLKMMNFFKTLANIKTFTVILIISVTWILVKGVNKILEFKFLCFSFIGAIILNSLLRIVFHRIGPSTIYTLFDISFTFPSGECFLSVVVYGFLSFLIIRHYYKPLLASIIITTSFLIVLLVGISMIYLNLQYASDIIAGCVFGVVWLTLNIILLEIYRILPSINYI